MLLSHVLRVIIITDQITRPSRDALAMVSATTCSPAAEDNSCLDATSNVMVNTEKSVNASGVSSPPGAQRGFEFGCWNTGSEPLQSRFIEYGSHVAAQRNGSNLLLNRVSTSALLVDPDERVEVLTWDRSRHWNGSTSPHWMSAFEALPMALATI